MMRDVLCGAVTESLVDKTLHLAGWVQARRNHGGVLFVDLRDRSGLVQVVFDPQNPDLFRVADTLRSEFVVAVKGLVRRRPEGTTNPNLGTGKVEVLATSLSILNQAVTPPFEISEYCNASEEVRLRYRYLDLRRPPLQKNMELRHRVVQTLRDVLYKDGFYDIETPILTHSTPEGARDFLVPARMNPGRWYALPQSPQLFKQVLMVGGFDRYYQIARCFRDEDLRADRQPEFTQVDIEMSFAEEADVQAVVENLLCATFKEALGVELKRPFPRMSYADARAKYGSDKPDLRIPGEIVDVSDVFRNTQFERLKAAIVQGGSAKALRYKGGAAFTRKEIDDLTKFAQSVGAKGLAWIKFLADGATESPIAKFLSPDEIESLRQAAKPEANDIVFLVSDRTKIAENVLGALRVHLWSNHTLKGQFPDVRSTHELLWITDFPLFEWSDEEGRWMATHHPFTSPRPEDIEALSKLDPQKEVTNPASVLGHFRARAYDIVLNGTELGGGSVRIHDPATQLKILTLLGLSETHAREEFGFLLEALASGAPPHAGVALGLDRTIALLSNEPSIRDVIAFPKTAKGTCLVSGAPGIAEDKQIKELGLRFVEAPAAPAPLKKG